MSPAKSRVGRRRPSTTRRTTPGRARKRVRAPKARRVALGDVIIERVLEWRTPRARRTVAVRIGRPVPDPEPRGDWLCPIQFVGFRRAGLSGVQPILGVDALQALVLALGHIQLELSALQDDLHTSGRARLTWLGSADLGFPAIFPPREGRRRGA